MKQTSIHIINNGLTRRRMANKSLLDFIRLSGYMPALASDTYFNKVVSLQGNTCVQLFANRGNYVRSYPMKNKNQTEEALHRFVIDISLPSSLLTDDALELTKSKWGKLCKKLGIIQKTTEPHCPWQNFTEPNGEGKAIKRAVRHLMRISNSSVRLWDYSWEYYCAIKRFTVTSNIHLDGLTHHEKVHGNMPKITELSYTAAVFS